MSLSVLFLGGPRDGQHFPVPDSLPSVIMIVPPVGLSDALIEPVPLYDPVPRPRDEPVPYRLWRQPNGAPAYVAPDWPPPRKACVVPGCKDAARIVFTAAERGRLAGREWAFGNPIDLCPAHASDVYRAQGVYGVNQLAEWLRPDARADLLDIVGIGSLDAEEYAASRAHALRVTR